jgi:DNA ligase-1
MRWRVRKFARLYAELDGTTSTNRKLEALQSYFRSAPQEDAAWALYFLAGGKPRQAVPTKMLRASAVVCAGIDDWLFDECYQAVGDLAECIALVLPPPQRSSDIGLAVWMNEHISPLRGASPEAIGLALAEFWDTLESGERFLLVKLIGGGFRVGVSKLLVTRALGTIAEIDSKLIAMMNMLSAADSRILSFSPTLCKPTHRYLANSATGRLNGSTTAFGRNWCDVKARVGSGPAARI